MVPRRLKLLPMIFIVLSFVIAPFALTGQTRGKISFEDDFETGTGKWDFHNPGKFRIIDSGDPAHGKVLSMHSGGPATYALIRGSDGWTDIRVEGDVFFPYFYHHYLGFIYNLNVTGNRIDFGSIFLLGPWGDDFVPYYQKYNSYQENPPEGFLGNVVLVNPHRDSNASRLLYSEYWVTLKGKDAVKPGEWHRFKAEVFGPVCHFYVDDMKTPKVTYDLFEYSSGRVGFKPRFVGSETRLDNIRVTSIEELSYTGPPLPAGRHYEREKLLTHWDVIGPFSRRMKDIEADGYLPGKSYPYNNGEKKWRPFEADARGCVLSGKVTEMYSGEWSAYFHTELRSETEKEATLHLSSTNGLYIWLNNTFLRLAGGQFTVWPDFQTNPEHQAVKFKVTLKPGINHLLVLVKGGRYGGDGFYAACY